VRAYARDMLRKLKHSAELSTLIVKPYGLVWKGGEWWLVAAPLRGEVQRYRLNHVDRLVRTGLTFTHPEEKFDLRQWWTTTLVSRARSSFTGYYPLSPC
jgi:predicted DNA-binding transcriptional regulator YafY